MLIKLIVGLSNPGIRYSGTRHNLGKEYLKLLAKFYGKFFKKSEFYGYISNLKLKDHDIHLLIPMYFMNKNGKSVIKMVNSYNILPEEILIVHDELDLNPGIIRLKFGGKHISHNGVKNIVKHLNSVNFYRLRIGIGRPKKKSEIINFVLSKPSFFDRKLINRAMNEALACMDILINNGLEMARNRLHAYKPTLK